MATIHHLVRDALLYDPGVSAALRAHLQSQGSRAFRRFDRMLRSRDAYAALGLGLTEFSALVPENPVLLSTALWACLAMQRDGYLRQRAVIELARRPESISLAAVVNRITDPVPQVAAEARNALTSLLPSAAIPDLVWSLPLIDVVCAVSAAGHGGVSDAVDARLLGSADLAVAELERATQSSDQHVRLSAFTRIVRLFEADRTEQLELALDDPSPAVRAWAGRTAIATCAPPELDGILGLLWANRSPALRLMALRQYRRRGDIERIEAACFDGSANVRFYARRYLRKLGRRLEHRVRALGILEDPDARSGQIVGALAVLSEFGRAEDRSVIERFAGDARGKVAAEANRTLSLLR